MNDLSSGSTAVLDAVREGLDGVVMTAPVATVIATGRSRRRRRQARTAGLTATAALLVGVPVAALSSSPSAGRGAPNGTGTGVLSNVEPAAYVVRAQANGDVTVTWTKQGYFSDPAGLQNALRNAGFPVLVKVGEFCRGPQDDAALDPSGVGAGVADVMRASDNASGQAVFTFVRSALPAHIELFIGYLNAAQLAITQGAPGSVERIVPTGTDLVCTTQAPPPNATVGHRP